jgi:hypothetical protein
MIEAQNLVWDTASSTTGFVQPKTYKCSGPHRFFVAEVVGVEAEGLVHLLALCTDCGETIHKSFAVSSKAATLTLKNTKD